MTETTFRFVTTCPECDGEVHSERAITEIVDDRGLPCVPVDMVWMADFRCGDCRLVITVEEAFVDTEPIDDDEAGESRG